MKRNGNMQRVGIPIGPQKGAMMPVRILLPVVKMAGQRNPKKKRDRVYINGVRFA